MPRAVRLLLLAALAVMPADGQADDLAQVRERIAAAQERIAAARTELGRGQSALRDAERRQATVAAELRQARRREREIAASLARLESERQALDRAAARQSQALARDVRNAWQLARQSPLRTWLNADDPQRAARVSRYYEYLQRDRARRLEEFRGTRERLAAAGVRLEAERSALERAREELAGREREARVAADTRRQAVAALAGELKSQQDRLERLRADEAALKRAIATARDAFRDIPPEATGAPLAKRRGKLRPPVAGRVVSAFGAPLAEGKLRSSGLVIAAAEGSEVRAVHPGRVVYADWLRGYGLLAIVDHGDGILTIYGRNQSLLRGVGDWVAEGEPLATVGSTGGQAAPGLYFEIRVNGEPQDPARWLRR